MNWSADSNLTLLQTVQAEASWGLLPVGLPPSLACLGPFWRQMEEYKLAYVQTEGIPSSQVWTLAGPAKTKKGEEALIVCTIFLSDMPGQVPIG